MKTETDILDTPYPALYVATREDYPWLVTVTEQHSDGTVSGWACVTDHIYLWAGPPARLENVNVIPWDAERVATFARRDKPL